MMNESHNIADDRIGVMWLHALMTRSQDAPSIPHLADDKHLMALGALVAALRSIDQCALRHHHEHSVQKLLLYFAMIDDALNETS